MFSTKRQSSESITETKNVAIWESLITDLSSPEDDDDFMASDDSDDDGEFMDSRADRRAAAVPPPQLFHGEEQMQQKTNNFSGPSSNNRTSSDSTTSDVTAAAAAELSYQAPPRTLESPACLKDWISHYSREHPPRVNHMGRKMDDTYILKATQIALSLAKFLDRQNKRQQADMDETDDCVSSCINCEDIRVNNVMVKNVDSGEALLERTNLISSTRGGAGTGSNTERRQVLALGMILYELFTQGSSPPRQIQQCLKSSGSCCHLVHRCGYREQMRTMLMIGGRRGVTEERTRMMTRIITRRRAQKITLHKSHSYENNDEELVVMRGKRKLSPHYSNGLVFPAPSRD